MFDDLIDTAGTITEAAKLLVKEGAEKVYVCAAHGVFSGPAFQRLEEAGSKINSDFERLTRFHMIEAENRRK